MQNTNSEYNGLPYLAICHITLKKVALLLHQKGIYFKGAVK